VDQDGNAEVVIVELSLAPVSDDLNVSYPYTICDTDLKHKLKAEK
jgi:hypothetical protein